jgi:CheY-like chemotaxis protein
VPDAPRRLRILVADDLPLNLNLVSRLLRLHGFDVTAVADGGAALAALQAAFMPPAAGAAPAASFDLWCVPQRAQQCCHALRAATSSG